MVPVEASPAEAAAKQAQPQVSPEIHKNLNSQSEFPSWHHAISDMNHGEKNHFTAVALSANQLIRVTKRSKSAALCTHVLDAEPHKQYTVSYRTHVFEAFLVN